MNDSDPVTTVITEAIARAEEASVAWGEGEGEGVYVDPALKIGGDPEADDRRYLERRDREFGAAMEAVRRDSHHDPPVIKPMMGTTAARFARSRARGAGTPAGRAQSRSSSRGGDSGDDGSGDGDEPPGLAARARWRAEVTTRRENERLA